MRCFDTYHECIEIFQKQHKITIINQAVKNPHVPTEPLVMDHQKHVDCSVTRLLQKFSCYIRE
jgi:hypothetical protein